MPRGWTSHSRTPVALGQLPLNRLNRLRAGGGWIRQRLRVLDQQAEERIQRDNLSGLRDLPSVPAAVRRDSAFLERTHHVRSDPGQHVRRAAPCSSEL